MVKKANPFEHKILTRAGYNLDTTKLSVDELTLLKKELEVTPKTHPDYPGDNTSFKLYKTNNNIISIPRYYAEPKFGAPIKTVGMEAKKIDIKFNGKLRPEQKPVIKSCLESIKKKGGGLISLPCGGGKTVLAIKLACELGLKTLIIVHKTFLQNQWCERLEQFTNAKIGIIRQKKTDVAGKDVVIGMLQSIAMIDYDSKIFDDFGLVIIDECHHAPSRVFSRALRKVGCQYTIGLSATPNRQDGLTKVIHWYLGDTIYKVERKGDKNVLVKGFNYESNDPLFIEKKSWRNRKMVPNMPKMITNLAKVNSRNKFITDIIGNLLEKDGRKTLVLSARLDHLKILKSSVDEMIQTKVLAGTLEKNEYTTSYYVGGMKEYELTESAKADIIFATYHLAEEGLDIDQLNTLILATPKLDIVQSIGRIMRKPIKEGDILPMIIDIIDQLSIFAKWGQKRLTYYSNKKYAITEYQAFNTKCETVKEYLLRKKICNKNELKDDDSIRKHFIINHHSELEYEVAEDEEFIDHPLEKYIYETDFDSIFDVDNTIQDMLVDYDDKDDKDDKDNKNELSNKIFVRAKQLKAQKN
jgi:superfamily II DNA or RNA helicase